MSSTDRRPIVGFYAMLCVCAAWLSGTGAVLFPNGTLFEDKCKKTTTCEVLKYKTCLGSPLPYTHTSMILAEDSSTQEEAIEKLTMWSGKFGYIVKEYLDMLSVFCSLKTSIIVWKLFYNKIKYHLTNNFSCRLQCVVAVVLHVIIFNVNIHNGFI